MSNAADIAEAAADDRAAPETASRVVVVTGASRGLGREVALRLAGPHSHLVLIARTVGGLEEVDDGVRAAGGQATLVPLDLADAEAVERLAPALAARFGRVDGLAGCAGTLGALGPVAQSDDALWRQVIDVNLIAARRLLAALDPLLRASPAGRVVFATCAAGLEPVAYWNAYAVAKAGLEMLVQLYAAETARTALKVNLLDPGPMATTLRAAAFPGEDPATLPSPAAAAGTVARLLAADWTLGGRRLTLDDLAG